MNGEAAAPRGTAAETSSATAKQLVRRLVGEDSADPPLKRRARAARRSQPLAERCGGRLASRDPLLDGHDAWQAKHDAAWAGHPTLGSYWQRIRTGYVEPLPRTPDDALAALRAAAGVAAGHGVPLADQLAAVRDGAKGATT